MGIVIPKGHGFYTSVKEMIYKSQTSIVVVRTIAEVTLEARVALVLLK